MHHGGELYEHLIKLNSVFSPLKRLSVWFNPMNQFLETKQLIKHIVYRGGALFLNEVSLHSKMLSTPHHDDYQLERSGVQEYGEHVVRPMYEIRSKHCIYQK